MTPFVIRCVLPVLRSCFSRSRCRSSPSQCPNAPTIPSVALPTSTPMARTRGSLCFRISRGLKSGNPKREPLACVSAQPQYAAGNNPRNSSVSAPFAAASGRIPPSTGATASHVVRYAINAVQSAHAYAAPRPPLIADPTRPRTG